MLKRNLLALAVASVLAGAATVGFAAEAAPATGQVGADQTTDTTPAKPGDKTTVDLSEIKVTGIRRSIESSIETKQAATSIVESVSAEDIGKLPDISIAESIARLPGLAAQRVAGRAQVISVRGLSPDFATT